ncbi:hypothetical protein Bbelb_216380 [Branchiostoma belcheri]|nr:hypothetical protein Bbelb_216380 [Branchiostoma belcheri]
MAKNMPSNTVSKAMVVRNEFFGEGMAKPDTGTVPPTFRQVAEGASHHISGRCEENKDNDDENLSNTSDAAAENSQTIDIGPGEFDTYAIAYICKEQAIRMKKAASKTAPDNSNDDIHLETSTFNANDSNVHTQARDPNPMYTQNMNPQPMDAKNDVNPNPMYLQRTMELIASPGPARNPNPMYTRNATNTYPTHSRNEVNPNPTYLQSSPGPTFKSNKSDDNPCTQTSADTHQQAFTRPATNNDDSISINDANDVLHALNPNLMYMPNVQHPAAHGCTRRRVIFSVYAAVILGFFVVAGVFLLLSLSARPPQPPVVSNTPHHKGGDVKQERITFGGKGREPGKFLRNMGTAVSADNEIFVADQLNDRVQVFSMNGRYLRLFPTVVPGESTRMRPYGVASDVKSGYLWVLVKSSLSNGHVVQYSKNGQPIKKFDVRFKGYFPVIAMDVRNNKVIVGDKTTIMMFDPNGSRLWSSEVPTVQEISGVTSDKEGNVLLTDWNQRVYKYNPSGVKIFEFGTWGDSLRGICLDTSGRIIVASFYNHRVDMFTSQGEFVRTIADIRQPWGVAMGPCGELVVTSPFTSTVTIFPRHMVLP